MVSGLIPLVPSWPSRGLFELSSENEDCLRLRVAGGEGGSSDSGKMTAEATTLEVGIVSKTVGWTILQHDLQWGFRHHRGAFESFTSKLQEPVKEAELCEDS